MEDARMVRPRYVADYNEREFLDDENDNDSVHALPLGSVETESDIDLQCTETFHDSRDEWDKITTSLFGKHADHSVKEDNDALVVASSREPKVYLPCDVKRILFEGGNRYVGFNERDHTHVIKWLYEKFEVEHALCGLQATHLRDMVFTKYIYGIHEMEARWLHDRFNPVLECKFHNISADAVAPIFDHPIEARILICKILGAFKFVHERHVLHGDVSPSNVGFHLETKPGVPGVVTPETIDQLLVVLLDFGAATFANDLQPPEFTRHLFREPRCVYVEGGGNQQGNLRFPLPSLDAWRLLFPLKEGTLRFPVPALDETKTQEDDQGRVEGTAGSPRVEGTAGSLSGSLSLYNMSSEIWAIGMLLLCFVCPQAWVDLDVTIAPKGRRIVFGIPEVNQRYKEFLEQRTLATFIKITTKYRGATWTKNNFKLVELIAWCMDSDPNKRPTSVNQMLTHAYFGTGVDTKNAPTPKSVVTVPDSHCHARTISLCIPIATMDTISTLFVQMYGYICLDREHHHSIQSNVVIFENTVTLFLGFVRLNEQMQTLLISSLDRDYELMQKLLYISVCVCTSLSIKFSRGRTFQYSNLEIKGMSREDLMWFERDFVQWYCVVQIEYPDEHMFSPSSGLRLSPKVLDACNYMQLSEERTLAHQLMSFELAKLGLVQQGQGTYKGNLRFP